MSIEDVFEAQERMLMFDYSCICNRVRKKLLEHREETLTIDRACRQEILAYEMVRVSSCSPFSMKP